MSEPSWSSIASWYDDVVSHGSGPHELAVETTLALLPPLAGSTVLDVGCGSGLATRAIASAGAGAVIGIDVTAEMISAARVHEADSPLGIEYRVDDGQTLATVGDESIDVVTCQLALMDIPDLAACLASVARVLRPGGVFVFIIGHPCFLAPRASTVTSADGSVGRLITSYLDDEFWRSDNPAGIRRVGNYHRSISTYLNALRAAGLVVDHVEERPAGDRLIVEQPVYANLPIEFAVRARKLRQASIDEIFDDLEVDQVARE